MQSQGVALGSIISALQAETHWPFADEWPPRPASATLTACDSSHAPAAEVGLRIDDDVLGLAAVGRWLC
jgi:hypothetical protein